jgi:5S rRNA maturation endonuclease (ribonuclease M5)
VDDIVEKVKSANPIEVVMEADGITLTGHGRYRRSKVHDSLIVDLTKQYYSWNSKGQAGDVIEWLMRFHGWDFKQAVEDLARRANLEAPEWGHGGHVAAAAARAREEALDVAAGVFASWLWGAGDAPGTPLAYARSRGWSDEVIKEARLGWTGDWNRDADKKMYTELAEAIQMRCGIVIQSGAHASLGEGGPAGLSAAIAILGFKGDIKSLGLSTDQMRPDWVEEGRIPSFYGRDMLVYPHERGGRVRYLSGRGIRQKMHYNLPGELVGDRQPYFNHMYGARSEICVIVEGQADAVSLAQWEIAGVALSGTAADNALLNALRGHQRLYVGLDEDRAGQNTCSPIAEALGPSCRIIHWKKLVESITKPDLKAGRVYTREQASKDKESSPLSPILPVPAPVRSVAGSDELQVSLPAAHASGKDRSAAADVSELTDEQLTEMAKAKEAWTPDSEENQNGKR